MRTGDIFDPALMMVQVFKELKMDPKDPNLTKQYLINRMQQVVHDPKVKAPYWVKERYSNLIEVMQEHKFWDSQPIMSMTNKIHKTGLIKQFQKD